MSKSVILFRVISVGLVIFSLVQPSVMMAMKQGIEDADTVRLRNYMNAHPVEQEEFIQRVLKENRLKNKIPGHKFTGPEDNFPLKNYEVVVDFLRDKRDFAFLNDEVSLDAAFGLTKLLVKRGFYPLAAQWEGAVGTLDEFRTEALAALKEVIDFEGPKSWTFHSYLWRAVINMDGYKKGVWGPQNAPLNEAWADLQAAEKLRNEFNFSKSVYLWMALLVAESGCRPLTLMVPAGEDIEVYHKTKAQEWFDIYTEARPVAAQAVAPLMQQALAAAALAPAPMAVAPGVAVAPVAAAPQIDHEDNIKQSSARTDYKNELKDQENRLKAALENWHVPLVPGASPLSSDSEEGGDEGPDGQDGPAGAGAMDESSDSSSYSLSSSEDEGGDDQNGGPVGSGGMTTVPVVMMGSAISLQTASSSGAAAMDQEADFLSGDEDEPARKKPARAEADVEEEDDEAQYTTPKGKGERKEEAKPAHKAHKKGWTFVSTPLSDEEMQIRNDLIKQYLENNTDGLLSYDQIAEKVATKLSKEWGREIVVSENVINNYVQRTGLSTKKMLPKETLAARNARILELYYDKAKSLTHAQIAAWVKAELGLEEMTEQIVDNTIQKTKSEGEKKKRLPRAIREIRNGRILELVKNNPSGLTYAQIADQVKAEFGLKELTETTVRVLVSRDKSEAEKKKMLPKETLAARNARILELYYDKAKSLTHAQIAAWVKAELNLEELTAAIVNLVVSNAKKEAAKKNQEK
ncbi:MAG: hypothetical protein ACK5PQ_02525 [Alphaproteobacteria bacterium]